MTAAGFVPGPCTDEGCAWFGDLFDDPHVHKSRVEVLEQRVERQGAELLDVYRRLAWALEDRVHELEGALAFHHDRDELRELDELADRRGDA